MKKVVLSCCLLLSVSSVLHAASKSEAITVVMKYSELVACMLPESDAGYSVVEVSTGMSGDELDRNDGATYLVHWLGDTGCHKGSGTVRSNYTVVEDTVGSGPMLVKKNMVDQGFGVRVLYSITAQEVDRGTIITINGTVPGETKWEEKEVTYKLKYDYSDFTIIE